MRSALSMVISPWSNARSWRALSSRPFSGDSLTLFSFRQLAANVLERDGGIILTRPGLEEQLHGLSSQGVSLLLVVFPDLLVKLAGMRQAPAFAHGVKRFDVAKLGGSR